MARSFERKLQPFAISNLTLYLVIGQTIVYLAELLGYIDLRQWILVPAFVLQGEYWRVFTFVLVPPAAHWALIAFALYFLYFMGTALENYWGPVRYNLFLLCGYVLTVAASFLHPVSIATNLFIGGSIFLAFAYLNPDYEILLFLILPVRVKWVALLTWIFYGYSLVVGSAATRISILAALGNFFLFFGGNLWLDLRSGKRRIAQNAARKESRTKSEPRHRCHVCGKTDQTNPEMDFRYCSKCSGDQCYCPEHIRNHQHVVTSDPSAR
jgi:membrane associated rhomboid family serine protease